MANNDPERPSSKSQLADEIDEIEGLDESVDSRLGDYPIDTLLIRKETRTVFDVVRRIRANGFILNPDFQRDFVWSPDKQSKLIESVVMRIPLPVFYLAEDKKGRTIVVDGLQRLSTFRAFLDNEFKLKLPKQESLDQKKFDDLPPKLQNRIEDCNLELYVIDAKVPDRAKLDIFERVNSGEPLTRQQMRNCLYMGNATRWLKEEASTELFLTVTGGSLDEKKMRDREFINRFAAFYLLGFEKYSKGDMDDFLAMGLQAMNEMNDVELAELSVTLRRSLGYNYALFNKHSFRKYAIGQSYRSVINASLWDVMSTELARITPEDFEIHREDVYLVCTKLIDNWEFKDAISNSPNSTNQVHKRFMLARQMFKENFGAHSNQS